VSGFRDPTLPEPPGSAISAPENADGSTIEGGTGGATDAVGNALAADKARTFTVKKR
jgi:hypothetical protein